MFAFSPRSLMAAALIAGGVVGLAASASAETAPSREKVNMIIVFGDDVCPASKGNEITVCARKAESERYRIPEPFRGATGPQNEAWTQKVMAYETVGAGGTQSCSPSGAGGWTGCQSQFIKNAYAEKKASSDVQFSKLIDAEREKRLSTIDEQAKADQADADAAQAAYLARKKAEAAKASGQ